MHCLPVSREAFFGVTFKFAQPAMVFARWYIMTVLKRMIKFVFFVVKAHHHIGREIWLEIEAWNDRDQKTGSTEKRNIYWSNKPRYVLSSCRRKPTQNHNEGILHR